MQSAYPSIHLGEVIHQYKEYVDEPEPRTYKKLSVKLYGRGVVLDEPVDGTFLKMRKHQIAKSGQVILSEIWGKKGAIGFVPPEGEGALCTSHFFLFDVVKEKIDPQYLNLVFKSNLLENQLDSGAKGTTGYAAVRPKHLLTCEIPLPPLEEQRRIVARIEALATKIEEIRELRQTSYEYLSQLLQVRRKELISSIPLENWVPLNTFVCKLENGKSPACESRPATKDEWGILKVGAVTLGHYNPSENKAVPFGTAPNPQYEVKPGDFLMSRANTKDYVGACAVVKVDAPKILLSDKIFRFIFRENSEINSDYLSQVLKSPALRIQIEQQATGTSSSMKNISKEKVMNLKIPYLPIGDQIKIAEYLDRLEDKLSLIKKLKNEAFDQLQAILPTVLEKAFKGEL